MLEHPLHYAKMLDVVAIMQAMSKRWFVNKRCLDIGCNEGPISLAIVVRFHPASMVGIDTDEFLIKLACG